MIRISFIPNAGTYFGSGLLAPTQDCALEGTLEKDMKFPTIAAKYEGGDAFVK